MSHKPFSFIVVLVCVLAIIGQLGNHKFGNADPTILLSVTVAALGLTIGHLLYLVFRTDSQIDVVNKTKESIESEMLLHAWAKAKEEEKDLKSQKSFRGKLDEKDFKKMVNGEVVTLKLHPDAKAEIILADIGFSTMNLLIQDAVDRHG